METSEGRCFSKAAISGALHEVWPPTIAPNFVADDRIRREYKWCGWYQWQCNGGMTNVRIHGPKVLTTASMFFASTL